MKRQKIELHGVASDERKENQNAYNPEFNNPSVSNRSFSGQ
jgi:hypothetical protein